MIGVLDEYPLDFARPELRAILDILARVFYQPRALDGMIHDAGLNPGMIDYSGSASLQWHSILARARAEDRMAILLDVVGRLEPPVRKRIDELVGAQPVLEPRTGQPDDLSEPDGDGWKGFGAERQVVEGADTLLGIAFLSTGLARSRSICRITATFSPGKPRVHGTASLIAPGLLLTNHHVLHDWADSDRPASTVVAWFGYELSEAGEEITPDIVACEAATITGQRDHDWAIIRTVEAPPADSRPLTLGGAQAPRKDDYVFIIQHPDGGPKMIGLSHNLVRHVDENVLQYWTDTKSGSSGAPVFNSQWQVVGLHHRWIDAPKGDSFAYRNQGRRIERVMEGLARHAVTV
jgi:V8-like Glu-specific endopeptidase